jgi:hypothetical protein
MRPADKVERVFARIDPDDPSATCTQLSKWADIIEEAVEEHGEGFAVDLQKYSAEYITKAVMSPALGENPDWEYLVSLCEEQPPVKGEITNRPITCAIATGILEERHYNSISNVPEAAYNYLLEVGKQVNPGQAWENSFCVGWCIDHPQISVIDDLEDALPEHEIFVSAALKSAWYADRSAAMELTKRAINSEETDRDLIFLEPPNSFLEVEKLEHPSPEFYSPHQTPSKKDLITKETIKEINNIIEENDLIEPIAWSKSIQNFPNTAVY